MADANDVQPLMPMATAVWLVDNTALTFSQIAVFCGLHVLEIKSIADDSVATKIVGFDPIRAGQLTWVEIERCQRDPTARVVLQGAPIPAKRTKGPRYTPVSKRQEKPDAIAWLVRYHPELTDGQVGRLVGTTKQTIAAVRDKTHWDTANIKPQDPVALGLCTQRELDLMVAKAAKDKPKVVVEDDLDEEAGRLEDELKRRRQQQRLAADAPPEEVRTAPVPLTAETLFAKRNPKN